MTTGTSVLAPGDWVEIVAKNREPDGSTERAPSVFGVELHVGGQTTVCFEGDNVGTSRPFRHVFGFTRERLQPYHLNAVLVVCLTSVAPAALRDIGFEVRADGLPRVGAIGRLEGFDKFKSAAGALDDPEEEKRLQRDLRLIFQDESDGFETLIGFGLRGGERCMFPRVGAASQIRIAAALLEPIMDRLRAARVSATGRSAREDPLSDLISSLAAFIRLLHGVVGAMPEATIKNEGARWLKRIERWIPRVLSALQARDGRAALMKLVMAVAFPRQKPTREQIQELLDAMGPEVEDALDTIRERARRDAACDLCRDVLRERFAPLPTRVRDELDSASYGQLRKWLLRSLTAGSLRDVFRPGSTPRAKTPPAGRPSEKKAKKSTPAKKKPRSAAVPPSSRRPSGKKAKTPSRATKQR